MKSALISPLLAGLLLLTGCAQPAAQAGGGGGGTIKAHSKLGYRSPAQYETLASPAAQLPACA